MGLFVLAWLVGEGIITYRSVKTLRMPPSPGEMLAASGLFVGLAVLAQYQPARAAATTFAWAVDAAVLMKVLPGGSNSPQAKKGAAGWAGIPAAGNTVIFPNGSAASATVASSDSTSGTGGSVTAAAPTGGTVLQMITQLAGQFGWNNPTQISAWRNILGAESSGGIPSALNPSGAYGAAQALGHAGPGQSGCGHSAYGTLGVNLGGPFTDAQAQAANCGHLAEQLLWMALYIKGTYGSPAAAWKHEQTSHWY